ncbi:hypothetical protein Pelo_5573 [Pelomyxa schiedti]|nr:hypothetical protein Pelo_5573 [Pelomyxa schiedti]
MSTKVSVGEKLREYYAPNAKEQLVQRAQGTFETTPENRNDNVIGQGTTRSRHFFNLCSVFEKNHDNWRPTEWLVLNNLDYLDLFFIKLAGRTPGEGDKSSLERTWAITALGDSFFQPSVFAARATASVYKRPDVDIISALASGMSCGNHMLSAWYCMKHIQAIKDQLTRSTSNSTVTDEDLVCAVQTLLAHYGESEEAALHDEECRPVPPFDANVKTNAPKEKETALSCVHDEVDLILDILPANSLSRRIFDVARVLLCRSGLVPNGDTASGVVFSHLGFNYLASPLLAIFPRTLAFVCHALEEQHEPKPFQFHLKHVDGLAGVVKNAGVSPCPPPDPSLPFIPQSNQDHLQYIAPGKVIVVLGNDWKNLRLPKSKRWVNLAKWDAREQNWKTVDQLVNEGVLFFDLLFVKLTGNLPSPSQKKLLLSIMMKNCFGSGFYPVCHFVPKMTTDTYNNVQYMLLNSLVSFILSGGTDHTGAMNGVSADLESILHVVDRQKEKPIHDVIETYIEENLAANKIFMGFGHPVYHPDPRVAMAIFLIHTHSPEIFESRQAEVLLHLCNGLMRRKGSNSDPLDSLIYSTYGFASCLPFYLGSMSRLLSSLCHTLENFEHKRLHFTKKISGIQQLLLNDFTSVEQHIEEEKTGTPPNPYTPEDGRQSTQLEGIAAVLGS